MRISIAVHGRFHAFDLAAALLQAGHDVELLTNLPRSRVAAWFPAERTHSAAWHGVWARAVHRLAGGEPPAALEALLKRSFGSWAARLRSRGEWDVAHSWSGVAEESLKARSGRIVSMSRGSAHIGKQDELLAQEEARTGAMLERPSRWIVEREQREYQLADRIIVPSTFARRTFVDCGIAAHKVVAVPLAMRASGFTASARVIEARARRLAAGEKLRILYVGMLSYRKGMHDVARVLEQLGREMDFRLVGPQLPECRGLARAASRTAVIEPAVPQHSLPEIYAWGDIFFLPTIEDGFAVVLAQAQAAGLPILTTTNSGGPDIIAAGGQGWIVPARDAEAMIAQLQWCDAHRAELAAMTAALHERPPQRGWADVARDFVEAVSA